MLFYEQRFISDENTCMVFTCQTRKLQMKSQASSQRHASPMEIKLSAEQFKEFNPQRPCKQKDFYTNPILNTEVLTHFNEPTPAIA